MTPLLAPAIHPARNPLRRAGLTSCGAALVALVAACGQASGPACADDGPCGPAQTCVDGHCQDVPDPACRADDQCTTPGTCLTASGARCRAGRCAYPALPAGSFCDDGEPCTVDDRCDAAGACAGTPTASCLGGNGPGERCAADEDCASDLHCQHQACCALGSTCCRRDDDCGLCERCETASGACVLQAAGDDLRGECPADPAGCQAAGCDGARAACARKPADSPCGPCRRCDAAGQCLGDSLHHDDCPPCQECVDGLCVYQADGADRKGDCQEYPCTQLVWGWSGVTCHAFAGGTAANGTCDGAGSCWGRPASCSGQGAALAGCGDAACRASCPTGADAAAHDSAAEVCHTAGAQACPAYEYCDPSGTCAPGAANQDCYQLWRSGQTASGVYTLDPDGPGGFAPLQAFCDMTGLPDAAPGWMLAANRVPYSDPFGMDPLDWAHGVYDSDDRTGNFNLPVLPFYRAASQAIFALATGGERCSGQGLDCYDYILRVDLPPTTTKTHSPLCREAARSHQAFKVRGGSLEGSSLTAFLCEDALGWGNCGGYACRIGSHAYPFADDWAGYNNAAEVHSVGRYSGDADSTCRLCTGGGPYCCNNDQTADAVFTVWLRGGAADALRADAQPCDADALCASRRCVDGVCCAEACDTPCHTCAAPGQEGRCVPTAAGSDPRSDCSAVTCTSYIYGWDGGGASCLRYADATGLNGMCDGGGRCAAVVLACANPGAVAASCGDAACARACQPGAIATQHDSAVEVCHVDWQRHDCDPGERCDTSGTCVDCDECALGQTRCVVVDGTTDATADALQACAPAPNGCLRWTIQNYCDAGCGCVSGDRTFASCLQLRQFYTTPASGVYALDHDGPGPAAPFNVYCDMSTNGGGWTVMAYLRAPDQWDWPVFSDNGVVGDTSGGFSSGATLRSLPISAASFSEKLLLFRSLQERPDAVSPYVDLGAQWMTSGRDSSVAFTDVATSNGWIHYRDSFGAAYDDVVYACSHSCGTYRTYGMFADFDGSHGYHGTQGGDYGCRDGNNICWWSRGGGCNVGDLRCAYLTGSDEGVIYAVR